MTKQTRPLTLADLDYELPIELIAQRPVTVRDDSRLLVVDRERKSVRDAEFGEFASQFTAGDLLVVNNTKVVPAKLALRRESGGRLSGLFVRAADDGVWEVLLTNTGRLRPGERLALLPDAFGDVIELVEHVGRGRWRAYLVSDNDTLAVLDRVGRTPLPPYIRRSHNEADEEDRERYQTMFAARAGAVAAPTAALHFTPSVIQKLEARCVGRAEITLHVGPGTFGPVAAESLDAHAMHAEWYDVDEVSAEAVNACKGKGNRVVAVGTTTCRVLETRATKKGLVAGSGWTDLFIRPPFSFQAVDALLTNFHLPRSTLLALVMAFGGESLIREVYAHAVSKRYRFYSYGDAMLIV